MGERYFNNIEDRLNFIEFRQQLLFDNDDLSRLLFEYQITESEYDSIMDLMDSYRERLSKGEKIYSGEYEQSIYKIVPSRYGDYHFCEYLAQKFYDDRRWEEVFPALYGDSPKYSYLKDKK